MPFAAASSGPAGVRNATVRGRSPTAQTTLINLDQHDHILAVKDESTQPVRRFGSAHLYERFSCLLTKGLPALNQLSIHGSPAKIAANRRKLRSASNLSRKGKESVLSYYVAVGSAEQLPIIVS